jgi:hypothetical protein
LSSVLLPGGRGLLSVQLQIERRFSCCVGREEELPAVCSEFAFTCFHVSNSQELFSSGNFTDHLKNKCHALAWSGTPCEASAEETSGQLHGAEDRVYPIQRNNPPVVS